MNKKKYTLTLDSDAFNSLKSDFNQILRSTLNNMIQKEGEKAEVKISLKITLTQSTAPDLEEHRYEAEREVIVPKFEHKVTSVMQYKDEKSGITGGAEYELVWDKDAMAYVMRPIKNAQMDLFEYADLNEDEESEGSEDDAEA
jgi:hypothetical protein